MSQRETEDEVLSVVSIKVTSDVTAYCNASNDHGTVSTSFSLKASKFCLSTFLFVISCIFYVNMSGLIVKRKSTGRIY